MPKRPRAVWRAVRHQVGRRGAFLGFLAILDLGYAYSLWPYRVPRHVTLILPARIWAAAWLVAGLACAVGVFMRRDRVPYTFASAIKALWAMLYFHFWLVQRIPNMWISALVWLVFAFVVLMVSAWPDPVLMVDRKHSGRDCACSSGD